MAPHPYSILFITIDSCRYDTFEAADAPNLKRVGPLYRAQAPGSFTFSSHSAMFMGFTPGVDDEIAYANPHYSRMFRLAGGDGAIPPWIRVSGANIIDGFRRLGYLTVGTGATRWFNSDVLTARTLVRPFDKFFYPGDTHSLGLQVDFVMNVMKDVKEPLFLFINVGETHVPYWHEGASWPLDDGPCIAFRETGNDPALCALRQRACLEFVDTKLAPVLDQFENANAIVCADHGDAWGEGGQWGHGFHHPNVIEVPLMFRLVNPPTPTRPPTGTRPTRVDKVVRGASDALIELGRPLRRKLGGWRNGIR